MRKTLFLALLMGGAGNAHAFDSTTQGSVIAGYVTSKLTTTPFERKLVLGAQDDAAAFVASNGQIRGARLDAALAYLRHTQPQLHAADLELAEAILVQ
ncbi:DUF2388 domain-containing protein [Pseudomonas typographi]|uniref:DUF2388 domain-containing protein n=1 Tax=Pseudomonas typographi TaxID=2715964 RepID=A0ABR7Z4C3_9PSED|nr:DUF2388 domain-containing protein [Pseudomonas typographi]MBD1552982.1 DUF2388 domain-containing protein [Pseudomonas typographi]MBD1588357.1 DUF2388 domain-containing protein [Pseudomonas typographi]MBD1600328.1 DUF2388 domain-containing protein [Pseudomonas typographi]